MVKEFLFFGLVCAIWCVLLVYCDYQNRYHNRAIRPTVQTHIKGYLNVRKH